MRRRERLVDDRRHIPFDLPGFSPADACWLLIGHSQLSWVELLVLRAAAGGEDTVLGMTREQARGALAHWEGPINGLKLRPLGHWGTSVAWGGAPYDPEARALLAASESAFFDGAGVIS